MNGSNIQYVGFWIRFLAVVLDTFILLAIITPLLWLAYGTEYFLPKELMDLSNPDILESLNKLNSRPMVQGPMELIITYILPAVAVIILWRYKSATPGKMIFKARIVDAKTGELPSTGQCIGRYFAYTVSMLPLCLGFLWIAFDPRKQAWHDKLSGTVVVR